jgi:hypothetical protein
MGEVLLLLPNTVKTMWDVAHGPPQYIHEFTCTSHLVEPFKAACSLLYQMLIYEKFK